ncbi:MAG: restriction endonuclease subunit S [Methanoregula sp.]|nr:restriction endonuclease subunit S [Methanoregula sp.]
MTFFLDTKIADVPEGWKIAELKDIVDINPESHDPTQRPHEKFSYIDIDAVENGSGVINTVKELIGKDAPSRARRVVQTDDVIMSEVRPYLKAFALVPKKLNNQICSTGFAVLRSKGTVDPRYLLNVLFSNEVINQCNRMMVGAQYPALNDSQVKKILIPLPPLPEQSRIATILTTVDDAIQCSRQAAAETERLKAGVMQELMTKGIGHTEFKEEENVGIMPKEWDIGKLGDFGEIKYGFAQPPNSKENGIPMICAKDIDRGSIDWNTVNEIDPKSISHGKDLYLHKWDIIIVRSGVNTGDIGLFNYDKIAVAGYDLVFTPNQKRIDPTFISKYLLCSHRQSHFKAIGVRSAQSHLNSEQLFNTPIILPPLKEQQHITSILTTIDHKLSLQRQRTAHYEHLKQGLMNELLTGKRRVMVT